jgi:hypothetical protein
MKAWAYFQYLLLIATSLLACSAIAKQGDPSAEAFSIDSAARTVATQDGPDYGALLDDTAPIESAKPLPRSMKGYELYSWYDEADGNWFYTLITGTNRLKAVEVIVAEDNQATQHEWVKITAGGTEALKALLKRLPPGTELFWLDDERLEGARESTVKITLPEASVVETIENHCRQLDIQLHVNH